MPLLLVPLLIGATGGVVGFFIGNKTSKWVVPATVASTLIAAYKLGLLKVGK
jgi:hypothetical protein